MKFVKSGLFVLLAVALAIAISGGCSSKPKEIEPNWTTNIKAAGIPDSPIAGKINDKELKIAYVKVKKWSDDYDITFSSVKPDNACGVIIDNDAVNFSTKVIHAGTFEKDMDKEVKFEDYHAYYHFEQADGVPMSVNTDWAAKLVISEFDKTAKKVKGWAKFDFKDGKTSIAGSFEADYCE